MSGGTPPMSLLSLLILWKICHEHSTCGARIPVAGKLLDTESKSSEYFLMRVETKLLDMVVKTLQQMKETPIIAKCQLLDSYDMLITFYLVS